MALTLEEANRIVKASIDKAREMNIKISVAVCDAGGRLMAFNRMICAPTVKSGLIELHGSCGMKVIARPRTSSPTTRGFSRSRSRPLK